MWIQASLITFVLGLLPCLANAAVAQVPVFSTLKDPFVLSVQDNFRITLKYVEKYQDFVPVLSRDKSRLPAFKLTDGNLTTVEGKSTASTAPIPAIHPPPLAPVFFPKKTLREFAIPFNAVTQPNGILRLWSLNGPLVVSELRAGEPIRLKTPNNQDRTITLKIQIHHTYHKFGFIDSETSEEDSFEDQRFRYNPEIK